MFCVHQTSRRASTASNKNVRTHQLEFKKQIDHVHCTQLDEARQIYYGTPLPSKNQNKPVGIITPIVHEEKSKRPVVKTIPICRETGNTHRNQLGYYVFLISKLFLF